MERLAFLMHLYVVLICGITVYFGMQNQTIDFSNLNTLISSAKDSIKLVETIENKEEIIKEDEL